MLISGRSEPNRLKYLINASMLVLLGYVLVFIETAAARFFGLTGISYRNLSVITMVVAAWTIIFMLVILKKKSHSAAFEKFLYAAHLIVYLLMYGIWVYFLHDFRIFALFSSLLAITIVITYTNLVQSLIMSASTVIVYLAATVFSAYSNDNKENFINDVFFALCFIPPAVIISIIANQLYKKNNELEGSKKHLEQVNDRLIILNRELEYNHKMTRIEMELAHDIQKSLLPAVPSGNKSWDIALSYKPRNEVSGDFYDFYYMDGILKGLSLFDVSGHGVASGLVTILAKPVFSKYFYRYSSDSLGMVAESADHTLREELNNLNMYITGIIMRLEDDCLEYINAGHPDILYKRSKTCSVENISGIVNPGKFPPFSLIDTAADYKSVKILPEKGDSVLLYTDCITETNNLVKCRYGAERLVESYKQAPEGSAREILNFIIGEFYSFLDEKDIDDDCTLILVKKI